MRKIESWEELFMLKSLHICFLSVLYMALMVSSVSAGNNSGGAFSHWPDAGLTKCYNDTVEFPCPSIGAAFYGQDSQYVGPTRSYTTLGGGIMAQDNVTGLIWEIKTNVDDIKDYANPHDADNTYEWCDTNTNTNGGDEGTCSANNTKIFIDRLNSENFGGHNNWRVPTIKELATLIDDGRVKPAIDPIFASISLSTYQFSADNYYWSSTTVAGDPPYARQVNFFSGHISGYSAKSYDLHVRAVCGGQTPSTVNRFIDNGDTVTDTVTGLEWQKATMDITGSWDDTMNWKEALAATVNLTLAGKSDWRLPDINELRSLVDYSHYLPAIDPIFAVTTESNSYWSSTSDVYYTGRVKNVNFSHGGDADNVDKTNHLYVRAVRGNQIPLPPLPPPPGPPSKNGITPILLLLLKGK